MSKRYMLKMDKEIQKLKKEQEILIKKVCAELIKFEKGKIKIPKV